MISPLLSKFLFLIQPSLIHLGFHYISWVGRTTRWKIEGEENYIFERCKSQRPLIFAFWHDQLMMMPFCYASTIRRKKLAALISQSRDGEVVSHFIHKFGFESIRGSSSRGGASALVRLKRKIEEGFDLAITPDGPRGPRWQAQMGVISLASASGCTVLPIACDFKNKKMLQTWDNFKVPCPYNVATLVIGRAVEVDAKGTDSHFESKKKELQERLEEVNGRAEELTQNSHQISTAAANSTSSASSDSVGHAQRTVEYASHDLGRLPRIQSGLDALETKSDEKSGLVK